MNRILFAVKYLFVGSYLYWSRGELLANEKEGKNYTSNDDYYYCGLSLVRLFFFFFGEDVLFLFVFFGVIVFLFWCFFVSDESSHFTRC